MTPASRPPTFLLRRVVAAVVDSLLIASVWFGACAVFFMLGVGFASDLADLLLLGLVTVAFAGGIGQVIAWLYEAAFVSSRLEATPGKAIVGLRVVDAEGNRVGFGRATGRYWAKALTYIVFAVGSGVVAGPLGVLAGVAGGGAAADAFTLIGVAAGLVAGTWLAMVFRGPIHDLLAKTVVVRR